MPSTESTFGWGVLLRPTGPGPALCSGRGSVAAFPLPRPPGSIRIGPEDQEPKARVWMTSIIMPRGRVTAKMIASTGRAASMGLPAPATRSR